MITITTVCVEGQKMSDKVQKITNVYLCMKLPSPRLLIYREAHKEDQDSYLEYISGETCRVFYESPAKHVEVLLKHFTTNVRT